MKLMPYISGMKIISTLLLIVLVTLCSSCGSSTYMCAAYADNNIQPQNQECYADVNP